jgi:hypothetical protein
VLGLLGDRTMSPLQYDVTWRLGVLAREMEELEDAVAYFTSVVECPPPPMTAADIWVESGGANAEGAKGGGPLACQFHMIPTHCSLSLRGI